jgi:hypothetical protein
MEDGSHAMSHKIERTEFEMTIVKCHALVRQTTDELTKGRIEKLIAETEQKLREINAQGRLSWRAP